MTRYYGHHQVTCYYVAALTPPTPTRGEWLGMTEPDNPDKTDEKDYRPNARTISVLERALEYVELHDGPPAPRTWLRRAAEVLTTLPDLEEDDPNYQKLAEQLVEHLWKAQDEYFADDEPLDELSEIEVDVYVRGHRVEVRIQDRGVVTVRCPECRGTGEVPHPGSRLKEKKQ